jgi:ABC-2 type transport system permease protein
MLPKLAGRIGIVAYTAWRSSIVGRRGVGLALVAAVYPLIVVAIASGRRPNIDLIAASELLYSDLFLPILLLLVCLVLGVSLLRGEIEDDSIVYPVTRSLPRPVLVCGKFAGLMAAALLFLLPAAFVGFALGVALNAGPGVSLVGVGATLLVSTTVATAAYGAFFLLLGLVTRQALVIGLIYGFLWETFVPLLPGPLKELTLVYYLRDIGGHLASAGPIAQVPKLVSLGAAVAVPLVFALVAVFLSCVYIVHAELLTEPSPT